MKPAHVVSIAAMAHTVLMVLLVLRVMLRPHREPASRIAWVAVIAAIPAVGMLAYLLFGEVNIGRRRVARHREVLQGLPSLSAAAPGDEAHMSARIPREYEHLFRVGESISGWPAVGGNSGRLLADSNAAIDAMVADIDTARKHVHVLFYIWLADRNGTRIAEALQRAAGRGVKCRAMIDDLGSRGFRRSPLWRALRDAGVETASALPVGNPLLRPLRGRIDLRNHRKVVVIDGRITYCGSQNCADPEFRVKAKYAPWVDAVIRFEGPIARQNQHLFAGDWMTFANDDIAELLIPPIPAPQPGFAAQVIGTGPTVRNSAMPELFESLLYSARRELIITTPYYVPNESMQGAICAAAYRGVETTIVFPARNDSRVVAAASRSYYADLLNAGVRIFEYEGGLLHTKSLTLDGEVTLIGSANMDRRSFDLNYENNILLCDRALTADVRARQQSYIDQSREVTQEMVAEWPLSRRLWNNTLATLGPIL
jgi:cardiolipin synthase